MGNEQTTERISRLVLQMRLWKPVLGSSNGHAVWSSETIMSCKGDPSIEQMRADLLGGGWTPSHSGTIWTSLSGCSYYGPHKAWHVWAGEPMDAPGAQRAGRTS